MDIPTTSFDLVTSELDNHPFVRTMFTSSEHGHFELKWTMFGVPALFR